MITRIRSFLTGRKGATAIEYGLIAAGIAVVIVVAVNQLGGDSRYQIQGHQHESLGKQKELNSAKSPRPQFCPGQFS